MAYDLALPPDSSGSPPPKPPRSTISGSLLALARLQVQFFRPLPLEEFPVLTLAPDSTHKFDAGRKGGHFEIQPAFIHKRGGLVLWNRQGEYFGLFVDQFDTTLVIERLYPHTGAGQNLVLKNRPEKSPVTVPLNKAEIKRIPVGKELRVVVVFQDHKPAIHFFNKSQEPMEVLLFRAHFDPSLAADSADRSVSAGGASRSAAALSPRGFWNVIRIAAAQFNSSLVFFGLAVALIVGALLVRHHYVRQYIRQVRGEPYAVNLERQHFTTRLLDHSKNRALGTTELSYPIYQALTFLGRSRAARVETITVSDVQPPDPAGRRFELKVTVQGGETRTFAVDIKDAAGIRELQNFLFGGDFERAQTEAVAVPDILTSFLLLIFLAAGLFFVWSVWQLWDKVREITDSARVREFASPHKIIGALDADAQRNIGERLGADRDEQQILGEVDDYKVKKRELQSEQAARQKARKQQNSRPDDAAPK